MAMRLIRYREAGKPRSNTDYFLSHRSAVRYGIPRRCMRTIQPLKIYAIMCERKDPLKNDKID